MSDYTRSQPHPETQRAQSVPRRLGERLQPLAASGTHYCELVNELDAIVWEADPTTWQFTFVNQRAETILGYPMEQWLNDPHFWVNLIHPEDRTQAVEFCQSTTAQGRDHEFEYRALAADGRVVWLRDIVRLLRENGTVTGLRGLMVDITERKQAETERQVIFDIIQGVNVTANLDDLMRLIHQSLQKAIYAENCFVALYDPDTGMFDELFCVDQYDTPTPPQKLGKSCTAYVFRTGCPILITEETFRQLVEQREVELVGTPSACWLGVPLQTPSKTIGVLVVQHYENERAYTERDVQFLASIGGQIALAIERKQAEEALRRVEQKYHGIVENVGVGLYQSSPDGRIMTANPALVRLLGYDSLEELIAADIPREIYLNPGDRGKNLELLHRTGRLDGVELHLRRKDGEEVVVLESARAISDADGRVLYYEGTLMDITEKKALEKQLQQAQKMESIGTLAGGIAHDFNNLLQGILGYASLALQDTDPQAESYAYLRPILESAERAANMTRQMLTFSRHKEPVVEPVAINRLVEESLRMLRRMIPTTIEIQSRLDPDLWIVEADTTQIQQVLVNLCVNARDAMPGGGTLILETENCVISELEAEHQVGVLAGRHILITVSDTGTGMTPAVRDRIFEPFFTTKGIGEGTGLGLAVAYGIVRSHKGRISVYSEPGQGAVFRIYLPATEKEISTGADTTRAVSGGCETILVVDDEPVVLELACDILASYGYQRLTARDGEEAVRVFKEQMTAIDLVLLDLTMPKLNGLGCARQLRALNPAVRIIASSGYSAHTRDMLNGEVHAFVPKPYHPKDLAETVRMILDNS